MKPASVFMLGLLCALPGLAAIEGVVTNLSTGQPQAGVEVTLQRLTTTGKEQAGAARTDAGGAFRFDAPAPGNHLLQVVHQGVTYSHMMPQGAPAQGIRMEIYDVGRSGAQTKVSQHMILFEPTGSIVQVTETLAVLNSGKTTYNDPGSGTLRLFVPKEAGEDLIISAQTTQGMPLERPLEKTGQDSVYMVDYPIRPGETRFNLVYTVPRTEATAFASRILHSGQLRVVAPSGVTLTSDALTQIGQEPTMMASVYEVKGPAFSLEIRGEGTLRSDDHSHEEEAETGRGMRPIRPHLYNRLYWILGLTLLILLVGFLALAGAQKLHAGGQGSKPAGPRG